VLHANAHFANDELFRYLAAHVADRYPDTHIVAVRTASTPLGRRFSRLWRKTRRLGVLGALEIATSAPIAQRIHQRHSAAIDAGLRALSRPPAMPSPTAVVWTSTINGADAVSAFRALAPDLAIQAGAGIIQPQIYTVPRLGMLNVHHGIAPLMRGMQSTAWALFEGRPECLGATVHQVDAGIDTGTVLAYAPVTAERQDDIPSLFVRATERGVAQLLHVIERRLAGEQWAVTPPPGPQMYRSTMSGWKLWSLERRLAREGIARAG
jgi:folate-dependent phosphoribosylglycinamide formyltransferase PurN